MGTTNGAEVSPDGKRLYVNESAAQCGCLTSSQTAEWPTSGCCGWFPDHGFDGMRCDADGNLYITRYGKGTVMLSPEGEVLREINVLGARQFLLRRAGWPTGRHRSRTPAAGAVPCGNTGRGLDLLERRAAGAAVHSSMLWPSGSVT